MKPFLKVLFLLSINGVALGQTWKDLFPKSLITSLQAGSELQKKRSKKDFCSSFDKKNRKYKWDVPKCGSFDWQVLGHTRLGNPLVYLEIGEGLETSLIFSGVHPDELNPIPVALRIAETLKTQRLVAKGQKIVIAPLVNPDGFFIDRPLRTNSNGVDLNRNFNTVDWFSNSHRVWENRKKRARYFPGWAPNTERETQFQNKLIEKFQPVKILSLHAPLGIIDYDVSFTAQNKPKEMKESKDFAGKIARRTKNYRITDFNVYPGSLGNFAGVELNIPTFTIELKDANPDNFETHWNNVSKGLLFAATTRLKAGRIVGNDN